MPEHAFPLHDPKGPQAHEELHCRDCVPQLQSMVSNSFGEQTPSPVQLPVFVHAPQAQLDEQERACACEPHFPQETLFVSEVLAWHAPCPEHVPQLPHVLHEQAPVQVRVRCCMPQLPQACVCGVSVVLATQPLAPWQLPHVPQEPHEQPGSQSLE